MSVEGRGRPRTVYYDPARPDGDQPAFRAGEAGLVVIRRDGEVVWDARLLLSPNAVHALFHHGIIDRLNRLPLDLDPIGSGRESLLTPGCLEVAARILIEADRDTYGAIHEVEVGRRDGVIYRVTIDNRGYQRDLARLRDLVTLAWREGHAVRIRI